MRFPLLVAAAVMLVAPLPTPLPAQLPGSATNGWIDFRGVTAGSPGMDGSGVPTGPYRSTFSSTSLADAQARTGLEQFNVFCFDWRGLAADARVGVLTLTQAANDADLYGKFRSATDPDGRAVSISDFERRLRAGAWLTTQFGTSTKTWDEKHLALWSIFWDVGTGSPALPDFIGYGTGSNGGVATAQQWVNDAFVNGPSFDASQYRVLKMLDAQGNFDSRAQTFLARAIVPEPATYGMVAVGLLALGVVARRRRS